MEEFNEFNISIDENFIANALTIAMQMRGDLEEEDYLIVQDMQIDDKTGYLNLIVSKKRVTIN